MNIYFIQPSVNHNFVVAAANANEAIELIPARATARLQISLWRTGAPMPRGILAEDYQLEKIEKRSK